MSVLIANLAMYDWPEIRNQTDRLWAALASALRRRGLDAPARLDRETDHSAILRHPNLLLAQTCGYPYVKDLRGTVQLVATPVYSAPGCEGSDYLSWLVVRTDNPARQITDLADKVAAFNGPNSQSGYSALCAAIAPFARDGRFFASTIQTGGHLASLRAVAGGQADVCAVDAVCWALAGRHHPALTSDLRVLAASPAAPALPLITAGARPADEIAILRQALDEIATRADLEDCRAALLLDGFEVLDDAAYDRIEQIEAQAIARGYFQLT